ncbi:MAG: siderophore-interacting protein [Mycobacterium sp.]
MTFSYATVLETIRLSPRMIRIVLQVEDPAALAVKPAGDSAVGVYFPVSDRDAVDEDTVDQDTVDQDTEPEGRNYSVRAQDGARIDLDIVLHARGPGTEWAVSTKPGDRVGLDHARSWYRPPVGADWQLLVTDLSGLPACARVIEELPDDVPAIVLAEVVDDDDLAYLPTRANVTVIPTVGTGNGYASSRLAELTRDVDLPAGHGYCWFAGEAAESRTVRKHFRGLGWTVDQLDITGYWRFDSEKWDQEFALVADDLVAVYEKALADGKGDKVASEEFDEALERAGL